jgi:beta-lactamase regulating signal transducer with metallopeptidase domain
MPFVFVYILKLSVSLALVFLFYRFVLRKLTFYNWNRWYLLGYTLLSFIIPFIDISRVLQEQQWSDTSIVQWVPVIQPQGVFPVESNTGNAFTAWDLVTLLLVLGMLLMLFRLLLQLVSFRRMIRKASPLAIGPLPGSGMKLYQVEENIIPFSFGNAIFINYRLHTTDELREIVWHEFIHVKQRHSVDIICGELLCLLNWYNPFAWLLRRSIRQNLEFIADNKVLENGISRKEYQYLLLKVIGNNHFSIAPKFNFSSLKKRIAMMNKMKSAGVHLVKFLFILPVVAVLLVAFRNNYENRKTSRPVINNIAGTDTLPRAQQKIPKEISSINVMESTTETNVGLKKKLSGMVVIKRTDGEKEIYDLGSAESLEKFEKKYGVKLEDLVPPPPIPPVPAVQATPALPPTAPVPPARSKEAIPAITPVPESNGEGINLSGVSNEYEITDKKAFIKLKDGTVENYDLANKKERAAFEKKYGKLIHVNTNINTTVNTAVKAELRTNITTAVNVNVNKTTDPVVITTPVAMSPAVIAAGSNATGVIAPAALRTTVRPSIATARPITGVTAVIDDYSYAITGKEDIVITITNKTTRQELENFKTRMKEKGVVLDFDEIEYNEKGILVTITGTMTAGDSKSKFVATDFYKLVLAMIRKDDRVYFKVSTRDNKTVI